MIEKELNHVLIIYDIELPEFNIEKENMIVLTSSNNYEIINKYFKSNIVLNYIKYEDFSFDNKYDYIIFYFTDSTIYLTDSFINNIKNIKDNNEDFNILVSFDDKNFMPNIENYFKKTEKIIQIVSNIDFNNNLIEDFLNKIWKFNEKIQITKKIDKNQKDIDINNEEKFLNIFDNLLQFKSNKDNYNKNEKKEKASNLIMELANNLDL